MVVWEEGNMLTLLRETAALTESSGEPIMLQGGQKVEFEATSTMHDPKTLLESAA